MRYLLAFLLTISVEIILAQTENNFTVTGKIIDGSNQQSLSNASVFCQNTTFGTVSDNEGAFKLVLPNGGYDLIISYTGFETKTIHINHNGSDNNNLVIELKQKDKTMEAVAVVGSTEVADGLAKYGNFFTENFIGSTPNSANCVIQNPEVLKFYYSKKRNRLKVMTKEELVILNNALGYKIRYQLDSFTYEYATNISTYTGYPLFEEMTGTGDQEKLWKQNRVKAYNGSRLHFIRSWRDSSLTQQGFVIERVDPNSATIETTPIENPYDTTLFRRVENDETEIVYQGRLRVLYRNEMPEKKFVTLMKLPPHVRVQISILDINEGFVIEQNGYFYDQSDVTNAGYWSWEKIGDLVPYNYVAQ